MLGRVSSKAEMATMVFRDKNLNKAKMENKQIKMVSVMMLRAVRCFLRRRKVIDLV